MDAFSITNHKGWNHWDYKIWGSGVWVVSVPVPHPGDPGGTRVRILGVTQLASFSHRRVAQNYPRATLKTTSHPESGLLLHRASKMSSRRQEEARQDGSTMNTPAQQRAGSTISPHQWESNHATGRNEKKKKKKKDVLLIGLKSQGNVHNFVQLMDET